MDENKIVNVKALLYDADTDEVKELFLKRKIKKFYMSMLIIIIGIMVLIFHKRF